METRGETPYNTATSETATGKLRGSTANIDMWVFRMAPLYPVKKDPKHPKYFASGCALDLKQVPNGFLSAGLACKDWRNIWHSGQSLVKH